MNLYEKLVEGFKEQAKMFPAGDALVVGETNNVPEMLAEIAIKIVYDHQNEEERKEYEDRW